MYPRTKTKWRPYLETLEARQLLSVYTDFNRDGFGFLATGDVSPDTPLNTRDGEDSDGDGLLDIWETNGIDVNQDGTIDLDLPALGAKPDHKDVFIEIDYMVNDGFTHKPDSQPDGTPLSTNPIQDVANAFANSPVPNPDGVDGIAFHHTIDESIPEVFNVFFLVRGPESNDDFDDLKNGSNDPNNLGSSCGTDPVDGHFGSLADRLSANCENILAARRMVFRYTIFANKIKEYPGVSGIAELPGNDFIVTLAPNFATSAQAIADKWGTSFDTEWKTMISGTFMHELGHTLNLRHGGADNFNGKPNYLSVMNYSFSFNLSGSAWKLPGIPDGTTVRTNRPLDYSRSQLINLDEANLDENQGIGGPVGLRTLFGRNGRRLITAAAGPIDWNVNGTFESSVSSDVNNIRFVSGGAGRILRGHDDWSNLDYNFRDDPDYDDGISLTGGRGEHSRCASPLHLEVVFSGLAQPGDTILREGVSSALLPDVSPHQSKFSAASEPHVARQAALDPSASVAASPESKAARPLANIAVAKPIHAAKLPPLFAFDIDLDKPLA